MRDILCREHAKGFSVGDVFTIPGCPDETKAIQKIYIKLNN